MTFINPCIYVRTLRTTYLFNYELSWAPNLNSPAFFKNNGDNNNVFSELVWTWTSCQNVARLEEDFFYHLCLFGIGLDLLHKIRWNNLVRDYVGSSRKALDQKRIRRLHWRIRWESKKDLKFYHDTVRKNKKFALTWKFFV